MATRKKKNSISDIVKMNKESDELLYGIDPEDLSNSDRLQEIEKKINIINTGYQDILKTNNLLEFLTQSQIINSERIENRINRVNKNNHRDSKKMMENILDSGTVRNIFNAERNRIESYSDYRIIDAYIPQVSRGIDLFRDSIMSPDDITKRSFNIGYDKDLDDDTKELLSGYLEDTKTSIDFDKKAKSWIRDGLVDGDVFVAVLKLDKELNAMLLNEDSKKDVLDLFNEPDEDGILLESEMFNESTSKYFENIFNEDIYGLADKVAKDNKTLTKDKSASLVSDAFKKELTNRFNDNIIIIKDKNKALNLSANYQDETSSLDSPIKMNGCIIRTLPPESVVKLETDDNVNYGYIYLEKYDIDGEYGDNGFGMSIKELMSSGGSSGNTYLSTNTGMHTSDMSSTTSISASLSSDYFDSFKSNGDGDTVVKEKLITDLFVKGISKKLDKKMIENNPQFKEVIYHLVKKDYLLNKKVKITYFEPNDIKHYKPDSDKVYGISKLSKIVFFAKLFLSTLLTESMQKISRGRDKRVIYVETGLDEDLEDSIQEVIREFKAKEIQSDILKSIGTVLRRIGTFEDYYIPRIDGETPLDFETISGMDVNVDDEFMQWLLKSMMTGMGLPNTYVDESNNVDFSRSLLMQNTTFVRDIVSDQRDAQEFLTDVLRQSFYYSYYSEINSNTNKENKESSKDKSKNTTVLTDLDLKSFWIELPIPEYLNLANTNEQIQNYQTKGDFIVNTYYDENNSDEKYQKERKLFQREVMKDLVTTVDWDKYDDMYKKLQLKIIRENLEEEANKPVSDTTGTDDLDAGDMDF